MEIVQPTAKNVKTAREIGDALEELRGELTRLSARNAVQLPALGELSLPPAAVQVFIGILRELARGHAVAVQCLDDRELTTREAAEVLGVSRPTLIDILEREEIPYRLVGTHRRVRQREVFAYLARMEREGTGARRRPRKERLRALQEMAESTEKLGLGY